MSGALRAIPLLTAALVALVAASFAGTSLPTRTAVPPASGSPAAAPSSLFTGTGAFDAAAAHRHLLYLGDPARGGRATGTAGYDDAAGYVAARFREMGLEPAGDAGTYLQHFAFGVPSLGANASLAITAPEPHAFVPRADFSELIGGPRGGGDVEAEIVYVGGAVDTPEYSDFANVDVRGRIALIAASSEGGDYAGNAIRHGASAILLVAANDPGPLIHYSYVSDIASQAVPTLLLTEPAADRIVAPAGTRVAELRTLADQARNLPGRTSFSFATRVVARVSVPLVIRFADTVNVLGVLRPPSGAPPDRWIVVGGHLDGVGSDPDGTVYPAANDNASGVAVLIEVARALSARRADLRLGVLFAAWAGEEEGLQGSREFLRRAPGTRFAPEHVLAYLNLDVVGCCGDRLAASQENASLFAAIASAAKKAGTGLGAARGSSDHESFARAGVPAALVIWSQIGTIHTPGDTVAAVDAEHLATVGTIVVQTVHDLAGPP